MHVRTRRQTGAWGQNFLPLFVLAGVLFALGGPVRAAGPLKLNADHVLVVDRDTGKTLYAKEADEAAPIASVTKLMTAIVLLDEKPNLKQKITITNDDVDRLKFSSSRLPVGARLSRAEMLHLTLMSSENRAAHALARTSSRGTEAFVAAMNAKARALGMQDAFFADPTGLSPRNRASAQDLHKLLEAASNYAPIQHYTTETFEQVKVGARRLNYRNSNPVVGRKGWDVLLSKTGFIREAGRVVVLGFKEAGRNLAVVLMGADSSAARTRDLVKVRDWVRDLAPRPVAKAAAKAPAAKAKAKAKARSKPSKAGKRKVVRRSRR